MAVDASHYTVERKLELAISNYLAGRRPSFNPALRVVAARPAQEHSVPCVIVETEDGDEDGARGAGNFRVPVKVYLWTEVHDTTEEQHQALAGWMFEALCQQAEILLALNKPGSLRGQAAGYPDTRAVRQLHLYAVYISSPKTATDKKMRGTKLELDVVCMGKDGG